MAKIYTMSVPEKATETFSMFMHTEFKKRFYFLAGDRLVASLNSRHGITHSTTEENNK
jgi:hypothetical protein